jgi:hypothetical protein
MDVRIDEMTSTVRATDSTALLDPGVLERVVRLVTARVRDELAHERRVAGERRLAPSGSPDESIGGGGAP